jgi:hypothetical protein
VRNEEGRIGRREQKGWERCWGKEGGGWLRVRLATLAMRWICIAFTACDLPNDALTEPNLFDCLRRYFWHVPYRHQCATITPSGSGRCLPPSSPHKNRKKNAKCSENRLGRSLNVRGKAPSTLCSKAYSEMRTDNWFRSQKYLNWWSPATFSLWSTEREKMVLFIAVTPMTESSTPPP